MVLDEDSLRGTPAGVQLPPDAGFPKAVVAVHDGAVLLEESAEIDDPVVLTHDTKVMQLLPVRGLASGQEVSAAVDAIVGFIEIARSSSASAG